MHFEFATAARIVFGPSSFKELAPAAAAMGTRVLLVQGVSGRHIAKFAEQLDTAGMATSAFHVAGEPTVELVVKGIEQARVERSDVVVAIGGGSVIDTGKAIAALLTNPGEVLDYLEVVGKGRPLSEPAAPCIAVPTTAGTGAEVTRNAVLAVKQRQVKVSLRSPTMLPRIALVDPELTYGLPPAITATSGLDALTQLIEPFLSNASNPMTDAVCREGIRRAARSLKRAYAADDPAAREDMALAALLSGMALANARLGAAHGFAGPIGGMFPAPHGAICARLLPVVMEINLRAIRERAPKLPVLGRFAEVSCLLTGDPQARPEDGIRWLEQLVQELHIPPLSAYGVQASGLPDIIAQSKKASSMKGNPIELSEAELEEIVRAAL